MPLATAALLITIAANIANNSSAGFRSIEVYIGTKQYESARVGTHETVVTKAGTKGKVVDTKGSWHSQSGQDKTIAKLHGLKRGGFFIDLASNEPLHLSNTRTLERDLGWQGPRCLHRRKCRAAPEIHQVSYVPLRTGGRN